VKKILIPLMVAALAFGFLGARASTPASAQTYSGTGPFTFYSNSSGEYWCFVSGDVEFRAAGTGAVSWVPVCPTPVAAVAAPVYSAPVTYSQPVTYATPPTQTVVVVADPCANNNAYGYAGVNPFGYGLGNPYGAGFAYGYNNGCGQNYNAGFGCLAFGCRNNAFPWACTAPGSCGQGLPPSHHHDHDCVPSTTVKCP
jgi:hypothetical protein